MTIRYGTRDIVRNPSLLRIGTNESFIIELKKIEFGIKEMLGL